MRDAPRPPDAPQPPNVPGLSTRAGDVILLSPRPDRRDPVSAFITLFTGSQFSHIILALGPDRFADAIPDDADDAERDTGDPPGISIFGAEHLDAILARRPAGPLRRVDVDVDPVALLREVEKIRAHAAGPNPRVRFADGAVLALAVLRGLLALPEPLQRLPIIEQARDAAIYVSEQHADSRLFCSEFVYRVLRGAGAEVAPSPQPVVDVTEFPVEAIEGVLSQDAPAGVAGWLLRQFDVDAGRVQTVRETWEAFQDAYRQDLTPHAIDPANYWTPQDFVMSPSYHLVAERPTGTGRWTAVEVAHVT